MTKTKRPEIRSTTILALRHGGATVIAGRGLWLDTNNAFRDVVKGDAIIAEAASADGKFRMEAGDQLIVLGGALDSLAGAVYARGRPAEAEAIFRNAIDVFASLHDALGGRDLRQAAGQSALTGAACPRGSPGTRAPRSAPGTTPPPGPCTRRKRRAGC